MLRWNIVRNGLTHRTRGLYCPHDTVIVPDHIEPPEGPPRSALGRLIATAVDLLCIIDRAGYLRWINPAWERRLGWSSSELKREELLHWDPRVVRDVEQELGVD